VGLLILSPAENDQLAGDLRAGAQGTRADPAARQLLGDEAHDQLVETEPSIRLGDADAERAEVGHGLNRGVRDEVVGEMPLVGVGDDFRVRKAAKLVADGIELSVTETFTRPLALGQSASKLSARCGMVLIEQAGAARRQLTTGVAGAKVGWTEQFVLPHRQAPGELAEDLDESQPGDHLVKRICALAAVRPFQYGGQRGHRGGDPSKAVRGALVVVDIPPGEAGGQKPLSRVAIGLRGV
jgi:hypothetical protein